jgi:2-keto-3-deoxy-L-rhamnonate aldolase RhmA
MYRENHLKKRLIAGEKAIGCWLHLCSPIAAEVIALTGFDAVIIDHEHGPGDFLNTLSLLQAISATPTASVLRVPWNDPVYIKRVMDLGVEGVMVPSVDTPEQARAAVAACRYPPAGIRGAAYPMVRCADYGLKAEEYRANESDGVLVICQIESTTAVGNAADIAAVEGLDMLFIGPLDLSGSMGRLGRTEDPEFLELRGQAERIIKEAGKLMGGLAVKGDSPQGLIDRGYDLVTGTSDLLLVRDGAQAHLRALGR